MKVRIAAFCGAAQEQEWLPEKAEYSDEVKAWLHRNPTHWLLTQVTDDSGKTLEVRIRAGRDIDYLAAVSYLRDVIAARKKEAALFTPAAVSFTEDAAQAINNTGRPAEMVLARILEKHTGGNWPGLSEDDRRMNMRNLHKLDGPIFSRHKVGPVEFSLTTTNMVTVIDLYR